MNDESNLPTLDLTWLREDATPLIADTHFNHGNIQRYCQRPENWQATLIQNWNQRVAPTQKILHLGDFAFGGREQEQAVLQQLNGQIFLRRGNHDRSSIPTVTMITQDFELDFPAYRLLFSHSPRCLLDLEKETAPPKPVFNLHGHVHNNPHPETDDLWHLNLSVEMINYAPQLMGAIKKEISRRMALLREKKL